jgi:ectoine hydroxylase-related dioxygenase (phytanoyl-CoA dioxygenase family)
MSRSISSTIAVTSEKQRLQYKNEGYTVVKNLIPVGQTDAVREMLLEILEGNHNWPDSHFQILDPTLYKSKKGGFLPVGVQQPAKMSSVFVGIADHPRLQAAMSELLDGPVSRYTDQALIKSTYIKEEQGGATFFHQDSYYWHIEPELGCNSWIALDDVNKDEIALAVLPSSHIGWKLAEHEQYYDDPKACNASNNKPYQRHRIPFKDIDFSKEIILPINKGDAVFFTNYTWHRAESNKSGQHKCAYAIAYKRNP